MSTETGQSALHPLHARHRSRASFTAGSRHPSRPITSPRTSSKRRCARPRVVCFSSRVAMKLGHMVPPDVRRHFPMPKQRSVAAAKLPSSAKLKYVGSARGL